MRGDASRRDHSVRRGGATRAARCDLVLRRDSRRTRKPIQGRSRPMRPLGGRPSRALSAPARGLSAHQPASPFLTTFRMSSAAKLSGYWPSLSRPANHFIGYQDETQRVLQAFEIDPRWLGIVDLSSATLFMYAQRIGLLQAIEDRRESRAILFVTGDRPGLETQIHHEVYDYFGEEPWGRV